MVQGLFGGATSYDGQSLTHISKDIDCWIELSTDTLSIFTKGIDHLKKVNFWHKIDFNFCCLLNDTIIYLETYLHDLHHVKESINNDNITKRDVTLLSKLGRDAFELNKEYGITYHNEERFWKDYGNPDFRIAENLYQEGRDFFVTLQDAVNSSYRLEDYISEKSSIINQNQINISESSNINAIAGNHVGNVSISNDLHDNFEQERKIIIDEINNLDDLEESLKNYINELLLESSTSIQNNDKVNLDKSISNLKAFLRGMGDKGTKILDILSSAATIATFLSS